MLPDIPAGAETRRPCSLAVISLIAGVISFLGLGVFIATILFGLSSYASFAWVVPTLSIGIVVGLLALNKACKGLALRGGSAVAIAGIAINALPALFIVIWISVDSAGQVGTFYDLAREIRELSFR